MNTSLSNLYAELAVSRVQLDEDEFILNLLSQQSSSSSATDSQAISLIQQRHDKLAKEIRELEKQIRELENRRQR